MADTALNMLISLTELKSRLDPDFDPDLEQIATETIVDASNLARHYGRDAWDSEHVPPVVKTEVRNACVRYMKLVDGLLLGRAGEETEQYTDLQKKTGTVFFDADQIATIREAAGRGGNTYSVDIYNYSTAPPPDPWMRGVWPRGRTFPMGGRR